VVFPALPPLPEEVARACPPASLLSSPELGALVRADISLAILYSQCIAKHAAAVAAYNEARERMKEASRDH
jgi:hypothetical protein